MVVAENAALVELHGGGQRGAHRDRVHAEIIAQPVGLDDSVEITDPGVRP